MSHLNSRAVPMRYLVAFLFLGAAGCGLGDYQRQMDAQRTRIKEFDETNALLDDPIDMPVIQSSKGEDASAWLIDFYLRLPKGCGTAVKDRAPYFMASFPFFRYGGTDPAYNYFVCAAVLLERKAEAEYDKYSMKEFRTYCILAIEDFFRKTYRTPITLPTPERAGKARKVVDQFLSVTPLSGTPEQIGYDEIVYQTTGKEEYQFRVYFHEAAGKQICIVAQRPLPMLPESTFDKSLEACLRTLDLSPEASARRQQFRERKR